MKKCIPLLFVLLSLTSSCANYVKRIHGELDQNYNKTPQFKDDQNLKYYQKNAGGKAAGLGKNGQGVPPLNAANMQQIKQKSYRPTSSRGTPADNFFEDDVDGRLWDATEPKNFFFVNHVLFNLGDIVMIDVKKDLRNEINLELSRLFTPPSKIKKEEIKPPAGAPAAKEENAAANGEDGAGAEGGQETTYDKIPGILSEFIGKEYFLLRGRKEVFFKRRKRLIELQALIKKVDITPAKLANSDNFIEFNVTVLR